jgi:adenylate cyclase 10
MEFLSNIEYKSILGYLPATIIKNVIETKAAFTEKLPRHYVTESVGLFSDISGFTKLSEAFSKKGRVGPEFLTFCINRYMERIINIIGANGGDIFKFVGDAIMVIWPPDGSPNFLKNACKRACQCAMDIQKQLNDLEIIEDKKLSVKIGLGIGQCHILFVGGLFGRCEYLCVGECMRQACESETHSEHGGQVLMSEKVKENVEDSYYFREAEVQAGYKKNDNLKYFLITGEKNGNITGGTTKKADAFLMRKLFDIKRVREKVITLRQFLPAGVKGYLNIEKEDWCKEIRLVSLMFLNIKVDLSQLKCESDYMKVQILANTVQRSIYRTRGALNKFLMDDKGSVMLVAWGLPPMSSRNDPLDAVSSCITILHEFNKLGFQCAMGLTTGTCFTGVCGTVGNRREYSMLGEVVNLASRYMSAGLKYMENNKLNNIVVIDERTKNLIQNKIRCKYLFRSGVKGFNILFNFFTPVTDENEFFPTEDDPFPFIRTHCCNPVPFYNIDQFYKDQEDKEVKKKKINNQKNYLKNSLEMAGRVEEFDAFVKKLNEIYTKKLKKFFMIKGQYGCGKSFFIRKGLYSFFKDIEENKPLSEIYFNNPNLLFPNFVLCNYQTPMLEHIPFNGFSMIFRQIYLWLTKNYFKKEKKNSLEKINVKAFDKDENIKYPFDTLIGDEMAKLICKNHCLDQIEALEEMLATSKEDISLKIHFGDQDYIDKVLPFIESKKRLNNKNPKAKPRDPYFSKLEIKEDIHIINFLIELLILYKKQINSLKKTFVEIPLILVIEDTHFVDKYTITFLNNLLYNDYQELKPLIVILSYQEEFPTLKRRNDLMIKEKHILYKMSLSEFKKNNKEKVVNNLKINNMTSIQEIEEFIKIYVLENDIYEKFDSLFKVDPNLIRTLIDKSYGGNPLLIRELLEEFVKMKYIQNCVSEILITSDLDDMEKLRNWNDFNIPIRIEKICGEMIDSLHEREIIMLKHAATIGNLFDIETLLSILPFKGVTLPDLYQDLKKIEKKGMIETLYDLDHKKKTVVFKFCCPFLKETLYQRMLIEQRNDIHMQIARLIQKNHVSYLPNLKLEKLNLRKQLENGQKSIIKEMEAPVNVDSNENKEVLNVNSLKILIVKEICDKLRYMRNYSDDEIEQIEGKEKLAQALKYGMVEKKSDGKITWENRFFVITSKHVSYYYHLDEYIGDKVPLATFELKDIYELKQLSDSYYGNKKNIFKVSVSSWKKKEQIKGKRSYIFSCATLEDLYSWIISINFLKANAYYNIFTSHFGKIGLPLYKFKTKKPKKFFFNLEDKQYLYNIDNKSAVSTKEIATANSQIKKVNNVNVPIEKAITPELRKNVANLISNVFLCILGDIQYRLAKYHNDIDKDENEIKEIAVPPHLKSCSDLRNPEEEDDFNKSEEEEEEKSEKKEELIEKENENNSIKSKEEENSENKNDKINSDEKKEIIISEKNSEKEKILDKGEKLKNEKIEITDIIDISKNNDKNMIDGDNDENNNENEDENYNNNDDDFDDMDFDMNEEEEDTHIPKFFVKDKSIIQLNEYLIQ